MKARIFHNPRCSKSRAALALLQERGVELTVIDYLKTPPSKATLKTLVAKLGVGVAEIVRANEPDYREAVAAGRTPTDDELLDLLVETPRLLQRPIVEVGNRARIGRPPERVLELVE